MELNKHHFDNSIVLVAVPIDPLVVARDSKVPCIFVVSPNGETLSSLEASRWEIRAKNTNDVFSI